MCVRWNWENLRRVAPILCGNILIINSWFSTRLGHGVFATTDWLVVSPPAPPPPCIKFSALSGKELLKCPSSFTAKHAANAYFISFAHAVLASMMLRVTVINTGYDFFPPCANSNRAKHEKTSVSHPSSGQFVSLHSASDYCHRPFITPSIRTL